MLPWSLRPPVVDRLPGPLTGAIATGGTSRSRIEIVERDERVIEMHPLLAPRADQAWFGVERWREMESAVEEDVAAGRVATFERVERYAADLERGRRSWSGVRFQQT